MCHRPMVQCEIEGDLPGVTENVPDLLRYFLGFHKLSIIDRG